MNSLSVLPALHILCGYFWHHGHDDHQARRRRYSVVRLSWDGGLVSSSTERTKEKESQTSSEAFTKLSPGNIQARGRQGDGRYD